MASDSMCSRAEGVIRAGPPDNPLSRALRAAVSFPYLEPGQLATMALVRPRREPRPEKDKVDEHPQQLPE